MITARQIRNIIAYELIQIIKEELKEFTMFPEAQMIITTIILYYIVVLLAQDL